MDECIEEFTTEVNEAKAGLLQDNTREGVNANLNEDLVLERQATLKEGEIKSYQ